MKYAIFSVTIFMGTVQAQVGEIVALPNFGIDRAEVTIGQFDRYVRATTTTTRAEKEGGGFEYGAGWERRPGWSWRKPDGEATSADVPAVYPQGLSGKPRALPSCASRPLRLGRKAEPIHGLRVTARKVPTRARPIHGRVLRPQALPNKVSMACMTWEPMYGSGPPTVPTARGVNAVPSVALGGTAHLT